MPPQLKPVYQKIPNEFNFKTIRAVSVPHHLQTNLGHWIHFTVVENDHVPDPGNLTGPAVMIPKEHSVLIYNPLLHDVLDLISVPFSELLPKGEFPPLMRLHSLCRFGDALGSLTCDCGPQLMAARRAILERGSGFLIYTEQEGRNAGLTAKASFSRLIEVENTATSQTFAAVGLEKNDLRNYQVAVEIVQLLALKQIQMMTNNPKKMRPFIDAEIDVTRFGIEIPATLHDKAYLGDKRDSMEHLLSTTLEGDESNSHVKVARIFRELPHVVRQRHLETLQSILDEETKQREIFLYRQ